MAEYFRDDQLDLSLLEHEKGRVLIVRAGNRGTERVVPPAGEEWAFDRTIWARKVEVSISPTGRSVRVFVDGEEVKTRG